MAPSDLVRTSWIPGSRVSEAPDGAPEESGAVHLRLLGGFELRAGAHRVKISRRAQEILALLALRSSLDRSKLAGTLWQATTEAHALGSLRTALWRLNQQLPGCVVCDGRRLRLPSSTTVDVDDFVRRGRKLLDPTTTPRVEDLPDPWQAGDLLPDWEHEWLAIDRERLRQLRLHVCETAAQRLCELGHHSLALEYALGVVREEPTRESAYRTLIAVHLAEGNLGEARRAFSRCAAMLDRELGTAPSFTLDLMCPWSAPGAPAPGRRHWARPRARLATGRGS